MAKENKAPFIFLCRTIRIVIIIYGIYFIFVAILNMTLKETAGKIISVNEYEETYTEIKSNELAIRGKDIYYHYNLNETDYSGKRLSNFLIFPSLDLELNGNIPVYYCTFFPQYAVLFKGNLLYTFYNLLPLIILEIILFGITKKYDLNTIRSKDAAKEFAEELHESPKEDDNNKIIEMKDVFLEEVKNREKSMLFLDVPHESDGIVIESLFRAEQIPYMTKIFSAKYQHYWHRAFFILERDYEDAFSLMNEFVKKKNQTSEEDIVLYKKHEQA